ncbi:hypothetical protein KSS87_020587 [Heliosperma pusillum]|nr:hypothetical protein KSS87_020587 [Heliosperma pusillum]
MAPVRKSRSVNKRLPYSNEVSPSKGGNSPSKSNKRKRKVSDMLGPQWSKEELQRFYEAYRKYGKDWKKVAAAIRNRSLEMVEALYTMNRAYLSLPEGTASVAGLIAMMTDHYSIQEGSDSEQESNDGVGTVRKPHKRPRGKLQPKMRGLDRHLSDGPRSQSLPSSYGCLSLLKRRRPDGNQPRAVGKRTPRIPVRYIHDSIEKYISPPKQGLKSKLDADNDDDDVAHEVALTLAEASHRGGSPQASQTPNRKRETATILPAAFEMSSAKNTGNEIADDACGGSLGSTEGNNRFHREKPHFTGRKIAGTSVQQKPRKSYGKKVEIEDGADHDVDDIKEACSGTEEGQKFSSFESRNLAFVLPPGQASKKRSKKVLFGGDESVALDALQSLADLSFMMPSTTAEAESTMPFREGKETDIVQSRPQKIVIARTKQRASPSKSKRDQSPSKTVKCGKFSASDSRLIEILEQGIKPVTKSRRSSPNASRQYFEQLVKSSEHCSSCTDIKKEGDDQAVSPMQAPANININSLTKSRSRRKLNKEEINRNSRDLKNLETLVNDKSNAARLFSLDNIDRFKEKLSNCLSNYRVRRWCVCEWFYSAIDYPWFAKSEFIEYLYHVGLGHVPRLTRVEWGVIRSSLGKPRRFSEQFLNEEKEKLNYYRESVRHHYTELSTGKREGLPADLARPLTVGQRVISIHPQTREVHNGSILTVDHNRCRVQFDKPDLGVEFVKDIDCMPLNPLENMPTSLKRHNIVVDKVYEALKQFNVAEKSDDKMKEEFSKITLSHKVETVDGASDVSSGFLTNNMSKHSKFVDFVRFLLTICGNGNIKKSSDWENYNEDPTYKNDGVSGFFVFLNATLLGGSCDVWLNRTTFTLMQNIYRSLTDVNVVSDVHVWILFFLKSKPLINYASQGGFAIPNAHCKVGHSELVSPQQAITYKQSTVSQIQAKEADVRALAELTRALDKKKALVNELKYMNDDVSENSSLKGVDSFKKQYAAVLVQLNEILDQACYRLIYIHFSCTVLPRQKNVSSAILCLRQRNTYQGNSGLTGHKPMSSIEHRGNVVTSFNSLPPDSQETGSQVYEIVDSSRVNARKMVDAVFQVVSSLKKAANESHKIANGADRVTNLPSVDKSTMPLQATELNGSLACQNQLYSCTSSVVASDQAFGVGSNKVSSDEETRVPSELISNCVSTLLMIQKCTERQFPPAEVAQLLDFAVTSLQPRCSQNLPVYSEIQKCMGIIRNQILALIPT